MCLPVPELQKPAPRLWGRPSRGSLPPPWLPSTMPSPSPQGAPSGAKRRCCRVSGCDEPLDSGYCEVRGWWQQPAGGLAEQAQLP